MEPSFSPHCMQAADQSLKAVSPCIKTFFLQKASVEAASFQKCLGNSMRELGSPAAVKSKEDYAKIFERILSGGENFEGGLPNSHSVSSRNCGRKRRKRERKKEARRKRKKMQSPKMRRGFGCFCPFTSSPERQLNVC